MDPRLDPRSLLYQPTQDFSRYAPPSANAIPMTIKDAIHSQPNHLVQNNGLFRSKPIAATSYKPVLPIKSKEVQYYFCGKHKKNLPIEHFYAKDIEVNRHICKQCISYLVRKWTHQNRVRVMYNRFIYRVKKTFKIDTQQYAWKQHGQHICERLLIKKWGSLIQAKNKIAKDDYVITWPVGTKRFCLSDVILISLANAKRRPRRQGVKNRQ